MTHLRLAPMLCLLALPAACSNDDSGSSHSATAGGSGAVGAAGSTAVTGGSGGGASGAPAGVAGSAGVTGPVIVDCFQPVSSDPVLGYGELLTDATWNDPHVIRDGDRYVMYASASTSFTNHIVRIYRLESEDAATWILSPSTPVLEPVSPSEGVETPAVIQFGGQYHLFYTTYPGPNDPLTYTVGHATLSDGISWTVETTARVQPSGNSNDWNGLIVAEPAPVLFQDTLYLYFTAVGIDLGLGGSSQTIGLVTSTDAATFSEPQRALVPDRSVYPRADGWVGFSTPSAVVIDDAVHLFTDIASDAPDPDYEDDWLQVALHHAWSTNGVDGWQQDPQPVFVREDFAWTRREIRSINALVDRSTLRIWFAGDELYSLDAQGQREWHTDRWGIGAATCELTP